VVTLCQEKEGGGGVFLLPNHNKGEEEVERVGTSLDWNTEGKQRRLVERIDRQRLEALCPPPLRFSLAAPPVATSGSHQHLSIIIHPSSLVHYSCGPTKMREDETGRVLHP